MNSVCLAVFLLAASAGTDKKPTDGPRSPAEEQASFVLPSDLEIQLVAAEPDVADPVAISWDENSRMYVCEMGDYPVEPEGGLIRLLEDQDGDGRVDRSTIFADGLHYPTSALPYRGGVLVSAAPEILFLKDTDGDGRADQRQVLFTGFGEGNQQLRVNGLMWGLDGWVYGANGRSDGEVRCVSLVGQGAKELPATATTTPVSLRGRDFRFHPETGVIEPTAGFSQFGHAFDDFGNRFLSWNTVHIRHVVLDPLRLDPFLHLSPQEACAEIADHGSTGRVYPLSHTTKRFNAEEPGFFNASCGLTVYRGDLLPEAYRGNAFVCEPLSNIVHRDILQPEGATFVASRGHDEQESEFLASTDPWFRPVNLTTGPDGALYVIDFYRALVEHPQFVANQEARDRTDFREGHEVGRIWRIVPKESKPEAWPRLANLDEAELARELASTNGWARETAQRLLVERVTPATQEKLCAALTNTLHDSQSDVVRLSALWTLANLDRSQAADEVNREIAQSSPRVREHAAMIAADLPDHRSARNVIASFAQSEDPRLRLQSAWALCSLGIGETGFTAYEAGVALQNLWKIDGESPWFQRVMLSRRSLSPQKKGPEIIAALMLAIGEGSKKSSQQLTPGQAEFLESLSRDAAVYAPESISPLLLKLDAERAHLAAMAVLCGFVESNRLVGQAVIPLDPASSVDSSDVTQLRDRIVNVAKGLAGDSLAGTQERVRAIRVIALLPSEQSLPMLDELLESEQAVDVRVAAIRAMSAYADPEIAERLIALWPQSTPTVRRSILEVLLSRREFVPPIVAAIEEESLNAADFEPLHVERILRLCDAENRPRIEKLLSRRVDADRAKVIADHLPVLALPGDRSSGARVFVQNCQTCHAIQGRGQRIGPDLASVANRPAADVLVDVLDPSRNVSPDGMSYVVMVKDGRILSGLLGGETSDSITLKRADGQDTLPRSEIEEFRNTGKSLMPEGFERQLSAQNIADLLAFLKAGEPPGDDVLKAATP